MPNIVTYEQRTRISGAGLGPGPNSEGQGLAAVAQALENVGQDQLVLKRIEQNKREEQAQISANEELMGARSEWLTQLHTRKTSAEPGAPNFTPTVLADFDADAEERLERAQTPQAKQYLRGRLDDVRLGIQNEAMQFEAAAIHDQKVGQLASGLDAARTAVEFRPQDFETVLAEQTAAIVTGMPPEFHVKLSEQARAALSSSAVAGKIRSNPYAALKALNNESTEDAAVRALSFDDRQRLRNVAEAEIRSREADARDAQGRARAQLADRVEDSQAAYLAGIDVPEPPTRADFLAAFPADQQDEAARRFAAFAGIQQIGADLKTAARLAPDEQAALLETRRPTTVEGAAPALQAYSILATRIADLNKQLEADPAAYVAAYDPTTQAAADAFNAQPTAETAQAYALTSAAAQRSLGVITPRLLSEAQAHGMSERLALSGNGADAVNAIAQERSLWGRHWPQVLAEASPKLNPAVQVIALGMDPVPAARLASVAALSAEDAAKTLPANVKQADVKLEVQAQLQDFAATMSGLAGAEQQQARLADAAVALASSYIAGGEDMNTASERAAQEVVLSRYTLRSWRGSDLRMPKNIDDRLVVQGLGKIQPHLIETLGLDPDDVHWRTLPDDSGVVLEDVATNRPLAREDGTPYTFSFAELAQFGVNKAEDVRRLEAEYPQLRGQ